MTFYLRRLAALALIGLFLSARAGAEDLDVPLAEPDIPSTALPCLGPASAPTAQLPSVQALPQVELGVTALPPGPTQTRLAAMASNLPNGSGDSLRAWSASRAQFDGAAAASADSGIRSVAAQPQDAPAASSAPSPKAFSPAAPQPPALTQAEVVGGLAAAFNGAGLLLLHSAAAAAVFPALTIAAGAALHGLAFAAATAAVIYAVRGDSAGLKKALLLGTGALGVSAAGLVAAAAFAHGSHWAVMALSLSASNLYADAQKLRKASPDDVARIAVPALALTAFVAPTALLAAQMTNPLFGLAVALSYRSLSNGYLKTKVPLPKLPPVPPPSGGAPPPPLPAPPPQVPAPPASSRLLKTPVDPR